MKNPETARAFATVVEHGGQIASSLPPAQRALSIHQQWNGKLHPSVFDEKLSQLHKTLPARHQPENTSP
jgi:hypothetical protein